MDILGFSCFYHDSSACLIRDGQVIAAVQQERFSRKKHDLGFPKEAIEYCLKEGNTSIEKIDFVVFYEKPFLKFERLLGQMIQTFPHSLKAFVQTIPSWLTEKLAVPHFIKKMGYKKDIYFMEHHLSHAGSCFLVSPFKKAAILTIDGVGEYTTTSLAFGEGNNIKILKEIHFPHSIGLLYSTVTAYLGFKVNNSEYKVMGLAPYGKPAYLDKFRKLLEIKEDGSFQLDMDYFEYHYKMSMPSKKFIQLFGPSRKKEEELTQRHKDIAASLQAITEKAIFGILNQLYKITKSPNLCMAGGVALNSVANGKILKNTPFKRIFIQPAAGDAGTSLGAAFYLYNSILKKPRNFVFDSSTFGTSFSNEQIKKFLDKNEINYSEFKNDKELVKKNCKNDF